MQSGQAAAMPASEVSFPYIIAIACCLRGRLDKLAAASQSLVRRGEVSNGGEHKDLNVSDLSSGQVLSVHPEKM